MLSFMAKYKITYITFQILLKKNKKQKKHHSNLCKRLLGNNQTPAKLNEHAEKNSLQKSTCSFSFDLSQPHQYRHRSRRTQTRPRPERRAVPSAGDQSSS